MFLIVDDGGGCGQTMRKTALVSLALARFWLTWQAPLHVACDVSPFAPLPLSPLQPPQPVDIKRWADLRPHPSIIAGKIWWIRRALNEWRQKAERIQPRYYRVITAHRETRWVALSFIFVLPTMHEFSLRQLFLVDAIITVRCERQWTANVSSLVSRPLYYLKLCQCSWTTNRIE